MHGYMDYLEIVLRYLRNNFERRDLLMLSHLNFVGEYFGKL